MVYQWKPGSQFRVKADVAGKELARIEKTNNGLRPKDIVAEAKSAKSPIHDCFEWDDTLAARKHREETARLMVRSIVRIEVTGSETAPRQIQAYIHVRPPEREPCYLNSAAVMNDEELRAQAIHDALTLLKGLKKRFEHLSELKEVFAAIDRFAKRMEKKPAKAG